MERPTTIVYLTNSYPYGKGYSWEESEIKALASTFTSVYVIPYSFEGQHKPKPVPANVNVLVPVREFPDIPYSGLNQIFQLADRSIFYYSREFFAEKVFLKKYWFKSWLLESIKTKWLLRSQVMQFLNELNEKEKTVLYFFWGNNQTLLVPFIRSMGFEKIVVRFHGFDLYKERLGGYQPYKRNLLFSLDYALCISEHGKRYLEKHYSGLGNNVKVQRLGTTSGVTSKSSNDRRIRMVSCARMIKLKRLDLIAKALSLVKIPINWTHIGDGQEFENLKEMSRSLPENVECDFKGWLSPEDISEFYANQPIDMFISVSESEGIPVSIMEALASGIPVLSTDVGGISEIIDKEVGTLIEPDQNPESLAAEIMDFVRRVAEEGEVLKSKASQRFLDKCDREKLNKELVEFLTSGNVC